MEKVLFISHNSHQCGVYQFGKNTANVLSASAKYQFIYLECDHTNGFIEFLAALEQHKPNAVIFNWHHLTMQWLNNQLLNHTDNYMPKLKYAMIVHDDCVANFPRINAYIYDDPNFSEDKNRFSVGRFIPTYAPKCQPLDNVIGSFGFGGNHKGFFRIIQQVNKEFSEATVRLHIPTASLDNSNGIMAKQLIQEYKKMAAAGITIEASHDFLTTNQLLDWLASNTINCFFFDKELGRGISSSIDYALAVKRPIAITDSYMFRHIKNATPSILIERSSLKEIIANGTKPLEPFYERWTKENLIRNYEYILDTISMQNNVLRNNMPNSETLYNLTSNRVLTVDDQKQLVPVIEELKRLSPEIMPHKLPEAVFQNAFIFQQARTLAKKSDNIIVIGGFMDPIGPALQQLGYQVTITDPQIDGKALKDIWIESALSGIKYDLVICCSVLEHVEDDASFIKQMYEILKPGCKALLTTDYRYDWTDKIPKPEVDCRLYTAERLQYLINQLPQGSPIDPPEWAAIEPYFTYESAKYCFCSFAFQRTNEHYIDDNEVIKNYVTDLFKDLQASKNYILELKNHLSLVKKISPGIMKIANKLQDTANKYPKFAKFSKAILKSLQLSHIKISK